MESEGRGSFPLGRAAALCGAVLMVLLPHCGGSTVASGSAGSGGSGTTQGGAGQGGAGQGGVGQAGVGQGGVPQGCATTMIDAPVDSPACTSDADCPGPAPYKDHCGEVVPGGYRTCLSDVVTQTQCSNDPAGDQCGCNGRTCPTGFSCVLAVNSLPCGTGGSGGPNVCSAGCTPGGCPSGEACVRGLEPPIGACLPATCRTDQDCGGCSRCAPYWALPGLGDCSTVLQGLRCTCRTDSDCKPGQHCATDTGGVGGTPGYCF